jgi:hypothetical protein
MTCLLAWNDLLPSIYLFTKYGMLILENKDIACKRISKYLFLPTYLPTYNLLTLPYLSMPYLTTCKMFRHFEGRFLQTMYWKISMETPCFLQLKVTCDLKACPIKEKTYVGFYFCAFLHGDVTVAFFMFVHEDW